MPRRILFAIRSKLGDTLISYQCVRAYADAFPDDEVTLITREAYARLLREEPGIRVIGFDSRIGMAARLLWLRVTEKPFDLLAVLWGSGAPIRLIGRLVNARRKVAWTRRFAPEVFEEASLPQDHYLIDPAAATIRLFEPAFEPPSALAIPSLAARYRAASGKAAIGVVPIADEARRNLDVPALSNLVAGVQQRHPGVPIRIFVNPGNGGAAALLAASLPDGCELRPFRDLSVLIEEYMQLSHWVGTDTGLYHLAVSVGIPATVFFGPTQPHKIVMSRQPGAIAYRLKGLGEAHCEQKTCDRPLCLHAAIARWGETVPLTRIDETPPACPLRAMAAPALDELRIAHSG